MEASIEQRRGEGKGSGEAQEGGSRAEEVMMPSRGRDVTMSHDRGRIGISSECLLALGSNMSTIHNLVSNTWVKRRHILIIYCSQFTFN